MKRTLIGLVTLVFGVSMVFAVGQRSGSAASRDLVTLTISAFVQSPGPSGVYDDPVTKYIENALNVKLDISPIDDANYLTQLAGMIAAGDLPDVYSISGTGTTAEILRDSKVMLALDPYIEQYAKKTWADPMGRLMIEAGRLPSEFNPEGKLYSWGMARGSWDDGTFPTTGHFLLWDVYKKAGYPKLESFDNDLLDVLEKMVAVNPTSISGEKTYGLGAWFGDGQGWGDWAIDYTLAWQQGIVNDNKIAAVDLVDSKFVESNQLTDPNSYFWRTIHFYARANMRGLLDPDSFIQTSGMWDQKLYDGRYMFVVAGWRASGANTNYFDKIPGNTHTYISLPGIGSDKERRFTVNYGGERPYAVNSKTKYPERCVELLDFLSTYEFSRIAVNGLEGQTWNMVNGKPVPTDAFLAAEKNNEYKWATGAGIFHHFLGYGGGTVDPATQTPIDLTLTAKGQERKMNDTVRDFLNYYKQDSLLNVYTHAITKNTDGPPVESATDTLSEDLQLAMNNLQGYLFKNFTKAINVSSESQYERERDALIAGFKDYRADELYNWYYNHFHPTSNANTVKYRQLLSDALEAMKTYKGN
jgi:ABC-type glycerol-3-phosphate transport system substrate-binding protein